MRGPQTTRFLHRQTYRRRRLIDAARILPIAGLVLMLVPLLIGIDGAPEAEGRTSRVGLYLLGCWAALIVGAAFLSRALSHHNIEELRAPGSQEEDPF